MSGATRFILDHTVWTHDSFVPEVELALASAITPIWHATEAWLQRNNIAPPFWAFAWPGSLAMARHMLDNPELVRGKRVLDFAAGCGLAAIAAHRAGADSVAAAEIDPLAVAAIRLNAARNQVPVELLEGDIVGCAGRWDLILCGDVCYEAPMTAHILPWLQILAREAEVWVADPGRAYLPPAGLHEFARFDVPTTRELEDRDQRLTRLLRLEAA